MEYFLLLENGEMHPYTEEGKYIVSKILLDRDWDYALILPITHYKGQSREILKRMFRKVDKKWPWNSIWRFWG